MVVIINNIKVGFLGEHGLADGVLGEHIAWHHTKVVDVALEEGPTTVPPRKSN